MKLLWICIDFLLLMCKTIRVVSDQTCTDSFPTQDSIREAVSQSVVESVEDGHFFFPFINFACAATVTGWIFAGNSTGMNDSVLYYPEIHTWRRSVVMVNNLPQYSKISVVGNGAAPVLIAESLYRYTFTTPEQVVAGDILVVRIPPRESAAVLPLFQRSTGEIFDKYDVTTYDPVLVAFGVNATKDMYFPLVTPIIPGDVSSSSTFTQLSSSSEIVSSFSETSLSTRATVSSINSLFVTTSTVSTSSNALISTSISQGSDTVDSTTISLVNHRTTLGSLTMHQSSILTNQLSTEISVLIQTHSSSFVGISSNSVMASVLMSPSSPFTGTVDDSGVPVAVVAGSIVAAVLVLVIVGLVLVLVLLIVLNKKGNSKGEIASLPDGYTTAGSPFDNPNYTAINNNVQLVSVQSNSSTLVGENFAAHYEVPEFSDPIASPAFVFYENSFTDMSKMSNGIYSDNTNSELELEGFNSQTALINGRYKMGSVENEPSYSAVDPVGHYEMELSSAIYRTDYERPVTSRSNTMIGHQADNPVNQYQVINPPNNAATGAVIHDYSVLDGNILVPTEEERAILKQHSAVFDEQTYAHLGIIQKQKYENVVLFEKTEIYWKPSTQASVLYNQLSNQKFREIPRSHLRIVKHLGSGQFGTVNEGLWSVAQEQVPVAVKMVSPTSSDAEKVKLLREGAIMGQFDHCNVVKLHGLVTVGEPVMIVIELMPKGDLRNYLKAVRFELTQSLSLPDLPKQLIQFCTEVAEGMKYLSSKSFVHRDLAARNIFITQDLVCKIGDFGMSRDLDDDDYYVSQGGKIPIKWTAPEALRYKKYSPLSDVWSFGALMYEMWSLAHKPFEGFSNPQTIDLVHSGYRLPPPPGCPRSMYQLMIHCWHPDSSRRPKFSEIVESLSEDPRKLLSWRDIDKSVHLEASCLGAPLEAGQDLYPELQQTFIRNTIGKF